MMLSSRVVHGVQSKSGLSDVLHKMATKIYVLCRKGDRLQAVCSDRRWRGRPGAYKGQTVVIFLFKGVLVTFELQPPKFLCEI